MDRTKRQNSTLTLVVLAAALACLVWLIAAPGASANGGAPCCGDEPATGTPGKATIMKNGDALAPTGAPREVIDAIVAANRINTKPYKWGGGHRKWRDSGYDCSGAVSYVIGEPGAGLLSSPFDSGSLARSWGKRGKGTWITVYAHGGHTYAVIAGRRWDTSGGRPGLGPRWYKSTRSTAGGRYAAKRPKNPKL